MLTVTREPDGCVHIEVTRPSALAKLRDSGYRIISHEGVDRVCLPFFKETNMTPNNFADEEIESRFGWHKATIEGPDATQPKHNRLRRMFLDLAHELNDGLPPCRETSLAFTALEEASMWAHKAVAKLAPLEDVEFEQLLKKNIHDSLKRAGLNEAEATEAIQQMINDRVLV